MNSFLRKLIALSAREAQVKEKRSKKKPSSLVPAAKQNDGARICNRLLNTTLYTMREPTPRRKGKNSIEKVDVCEYYIVRVSVGLYLLRNIHLASTSSYR
jgi:hypothetical protein